MVSAKAHRLGTVAGIFVCVGLECAGQTTWRRTYGGPGVDQARSVQALSDGGYFVAGSTGSFGDGGDAYVLRLLANGDVDWSGYHGGPGAQTAVACADLADGFAVAGTTSTGSQGGYDMWLFKLDASGAFLWEKHIGGSEWDICHDMAALSDGFVLVGTTYGQTAGSGDAWVVRTDLLGDTLWTRRIGGEGLDEALGVHIDPEGRIMVAGVMDRESEQEDAFVTRLTSSGGIDWTRRFGGDGPDRAEAVATTADGGYAAVGTTYSNVETAHILLYRMDQAGEELWQVAHGNEGDMEAGQVHVRADGGFVLAGYNSAYNAGGRDMVLFLLAADGGWQLGKNFGSPDDEAGHDVQLLSDGGFIVAGTSDHYGPGAGAMFVVRCDADGNTEDDTVYPFNDPVSVGSITGPRISPVRVYPIPSDGRFHLAMEPMPDRVVLHSLDGQVVAQYTMPVGAAYVETNLPSGPYLMALWHDDRPLGHVRLQILH